MPRRRISRSRSSTSRRHSRRRISRSPAGTARSRTKNPSPAKRRACSRVVGATVADIFALLTRQERSLPHHAAVVFSLIRGFLSFLAMSENLGLRSGVEGRVARHAAADGPSHAHRHAELELNLVVRGSASYLLGERRYELTPGTLTWLFPGQDHVLVDESADHELWWAVFRPSLVARTATMP